ncbi:MAG: hypothetical protein V3T05_10185 [Myxococcota bacterium]
MKRNIPVLSVLVAVAAVSLPAGAHRSSPQRAVVVQVDDLGAAALWHMQIKGARAAVLRRLHDRDGDGLLGERESLGVALTLLAKAVAGVEIAWDGEPVKPIDLDPRIEEDGASLRAFGLTTLRLPESGGRVATHRLSVRVAPGHGPLQLRLQTLGAWRVVAAAGLRVAADRRGLAELIVIEPGEGVELTVTKTVIKEGSAL